MAGRRKQNEIVDGFTTMRAAQRATASGRGKSAAPKKEAVAEKPKPKPPPARKAAVRIDHTTRPSKHDIVCYECGFTFSLTGSFEKTYCPKCRCILDAEKHTITREWAGIIRTVGTVVVEPSGCINGGKIYACNMILEGKIEGGEVNVSGRLEMRGKGSFDPAGVKVSDLIIADGAEVSFNRKVSFRNIEVSGRFKAKLTSTGMVRVKPGGYLLGEVKGHHLAVEEGGGLKARLAITAAVEAAAGSEKS